MPARKSDLRPALRPWQSHWLHGTLTGATPSPMEGNTPSGFRHLSEEKR